MPVTNAVATTEVSDDTRRSISTPDRVDTRLGTLSFVDGAPTPETSALLYDHLDFIHAVQAFDDSYPATSIAAIRKGFLAAGVRDNEILIFPELMDSASLFLTANSDTVYFLGFIDLSNGPMILEVPPLGPPTGILGVIDDMWWGWVTDFGIPGPDRGSGGTYLLVGPGYHGPLPDSGMHVTHARTTRVCLLGRAFLVDNDPSLPVHTITSGLRIYPYTAGGVGTAVATFLSGAAPLRAPADPSPTTFHRVAHFPMNTIPPNDETFWDAINDVVQQEPVGAGDADTLGLLASVGIVKGRPFAPDQRMRAILADAVRVGNAIARTVSMDPRPFEGWAYYPDSAWFNMLFQGGYTFVDPPPDITQTGAVARRPSDGARKLNSRTAFLYTATGITPAMCMRLTGIGSQYLLAMKDAAGEFLDGARHYRLTLPAGIPEARFWSVTAYDRQTRSMLQTDQPMPRVNSQTGTVHTNTDASTTIWFGPDTPTGTEGNWVQTLPGKGWFAILRLYSPLPPFFDRTWRPSEINPATQG